MTLYKTVKRNIKNRIMNKFVLFIVMNDNEWERYLWYFTGEREGTNKLD